ncbi:MAG TPA: aminotransferase class I/II-fold pyridoxal phosphate-dependent enzyme [Epulopiscium sp.]|nr:aminotransferase class I/II-fold pyridoxal phosphate-dependent enzyme [Candidatus Epulonipiscium sp.]
MSAPLYDKLIKYSKKMTSFHMPGHKFGKVLNMKDIPFLNLDVTEVPGLDNLYESESIILKAQEEMARKYEAKESIFITNGSTSGIIASILTICSPGDTLIVARNCHHSVWNALILGGIRPIYINPSYNEEHNILGGIGDANLEQVLVKHPEAKGVVIVSPTYEGLVSDIQKVAKTVHKHNKILIVDEAHGAHFVWHQGFPNSATRQDADIVIQSMHKTLPALTQSALVHIGSRKIDKKMITKRLQMIQTSSPSYVMMGIMDYVRAQMENQPEIWTNYVQELLKSRKSLMKMKKLLLLSKDICGKSNIYDMDESKLVIFTYNADITGIELGKILRSKYNIQVEVESEEYIIAMSTIGDSPNDLNLFSKALLEIDSTLKKDTTKKKYNKELNIENKSTMLPREIYFGKKENIPFEESIGRISGTNIMLYPPGIPLICIGEVFSRETIDCIKNLSTHLLGITRENNEIKVSVSKEGENDER